MSKLRYVLVAVFLILSISLLASSGCSLFAPSNTSNSASVTPSGANLASLPYVDETIGSELTTTELVQKVAPAVVSIVTETVSYSWFWQAIPQTGAGTGIIISPDGYIVTNNHVVESAQKVTVTLSDGSAFAATVVGSDPQTDLAVVKIDASNLDYLHFLSNSLEQLSVLAPVVAVGNALALPGGPTWTTGVVSNLGRSIEEDTGVVLNDVIQTDAAINAGNSGGPLLDMAGQVVGINVAIASNAENIGFAISTDTAIPVIKSLIEGGQIVRSSQSGSASSVESPTSVIPSGANLGSPPYVDETISTELTTTELVEKVAPAVVSIVTETVSYNWFWQAVPETGAGTGIIISPDGYIVTNNHVVEGAQKVTVTLSDGSAFAATVVGSDAQTDLAVVKIDASNLAYLHFLSNSLEQLNDLDPVVAVGNALALPGGPTWTLGVVSNLGRSIEEDTGAVLNDIIQTDAAINPGNSGGPLLDMAGQVVGINVAIASNAENIGFAISTDTAIPVVQSLITEGKVARPWLGVEVATVTSTIQHYYNLSVDTGALIVSVTSGSPADKAGLRAGDVITKMDNEDISTAAELVSAISSHQIGDQVEIVYYRGSVQKVANATLEESPS
jgi:serine protease Do